MKIFNYIKDNICEPVEADNRRQADSMFISGFKVEVDEMTIDNNMKLEEMIVELTREVRELKSQLPSNKDQ